MNCSPSLVSTSILPAVDPPTVATLQPPTKIMTLRLKTDISRPREDADDEDDDSSKSRKVAPPSAASSSSSSSYDVRCGKGERMKRANADYLSRCRGKKDAFLAAGSYHAKRRIAEGIVDDISSRGGRYLKEDGEEMDWESAVKKTYNAVKDMTLKGARDTSSSSSRPPRARRSSSNASSSKKKDRRAGLAESRNDSSDRQMESSAGANDVVSQAQSGRETNTTECRTTKHDAPTVVKVVTTTDNARSVSMEGTTKPTTSNALTPPPSRAFAPSVAPSDRAWTPRSPPSPVSLSPSTRRFAMDFFADGPPLDPQSLLTPTRARRSPPHSTQVTPKSSWDDDDASGTTGLPSASAFFPPRYASLIAAPIRFGGQEGSPIEFFSPNNANAPYRDEQDNSLLVGEDLLDQDLVNLLEMQDFLGDISFR